MPTVGLREFKNHATNIVRAVREEAAEYGIPVDGEPVAVLPTTRLIDDWAPRAELLLGWTWVGAHVRPPARHA
jgi:prevent-host-death family protein